MNDRIKLIKKLLRRHRRELADLIGAYRASVEDPSTLRLVTYSGRDYYATATPGADYNDGGRDWLNVTDARTGASVACLD
jgi:hypothetical protein